MTPTPEQLARDRLIAFRRCMIREIEAPPHGEEIRVEDSVARDVCADLETLLSALQAKDAALKPFSDAYWAQIEESEIAMSVGGYVPCDDDAPVVLPLMLGHCRAAATALGGEPTDPSTQCELAVGRWVYRRVEAVQDAKPGTPEGAELDYLASVIVDVEEYGASGEHPPAKAAPRQTRRTEAEQLGLGEISSFGAGAEIRLLREALKRYGDHTRMAMAPPHLQEAIDRAMQAANMSPPRPLPPAPGGE